MNWRNWHRWVSLLIAAPFLIILLSGLLLTTRGYNPWMQPDYSRYAPASTRELTISFHQMLEAARSVPEAGIRGWDDVSQIDVRPKTGQIRLRSKHGHWEIQLDGGSGAVLGAGPRRVSWFVSLHEGALFGPWIRYGVFVPSAVGVLFLTLSGLVIFFQPYLRGRRR